MFLRLISWTRWAVILDPEAPRGWPNAIAPPLTLVFWRSRPSSFSTERYWAAKASFTCTQTHTTHKITTREYDLPGLLLRDSYLWLIIYIPHDKAGRSMGATGAACKGSSLIYHATVQDLPAVAVCVHVAVRSCASALTTLIQWNLRNKDTAGPLKTVLNSEVSFIQRLP